MSHFYGTLIGRGKKVTRTATKQSGLTSINNGWNIGVKVELDNKGEKNDEDFVTISITRGSNDNHVIASFDIKQTDLDKIQKDGIRHFLYWE